ncbi:hypothetical protein [Boseongicola sp. H5]|uniref:hypothetical protein n=1 Tax=Boseongicola sp. H5 TaxID=2763261 RepID=UPI001D0B0571|nr:hypothetical protein [Boseongicola sp. H5]
MKVKRQYSVKLERSELQPFMDLALVREKDYLEFSRSIVFHLLEDDERIPAVLRLLDGRKYGTYDTAAFSDEDLEAADHLALGFSWLNGYPQPDGDGASDYQRITYDPEGLCEGCGIYGKQITPFRLRLPPKWGRRKMFSLNWIFDEMFVETSYYEARFRPLGLEARDVVHHKSGDIIPTVKQIDLPDVDFGFQMDTSKGEICKVCGTPRYHPNVVDYLPPLNGDASTYPVFRANTYFGDGMNSFRKIVISSDVFSMLKDDKVRALYFHPIKNA